MSCSPLMLSAWKPNRSTLRRILTLPCNVHTAPAARPVNTQLLNAVSGSVAKLLIVGGPQLHLCHKQVHNWAKLRVRAPANRPCRPDPWEQGHPRGQHYHCLGSQPADHFPAVVGRWMKPTQGSPHPTPPGAEVVEVRLGSAQAGGISEDE